MSKVGLMALLALAVIGVGALVFFSGDPVPVDPELGGPTDAEEDAATRAEDPGGGPSSEGASARRPTLFGRAHVRIGVGDAVGRVADFTSKDPVEGATLRLTGSGYAGEPVSAETVSAVDGRFHFTALPAGEGYELEVVVEAKGVRKVIGVAVPARGVEDLGTIWLGDAGTLEGRVLGRDDEGVAGAEIHVIQGTLAEEEMLEDIVGFLLSLDRDPVPIARGTSDDSGRFRIEDVSPGPITVVARAPGHHQAVKTAAMTKEGALGGPVELRVAPAEPLSGRVVTESGAGVAEARIAFMDQQDSAGGFLGRRFVRTDAKGGFRVDAPPLGERLVAIVAAEGFPTLFANVEGEREGLEFVLLGGAHLTLRFVHDDDGEPIAEAAVVAMLSETESMGDSGTFLTGVTDAAGRVEFQARPGFVGMLFLQRGDFGSSMYSPQLGALGGMRGLGLKGPEKLELRAGDNEAELRKPRGVLLTGTVTDERGRPVAGAAVTTGGGLFGLGGAGKALTDEGGTYRLAVPTLGQVPVTVEATGYVQDPETRMAKVPEGAVEAEHHVVLLAAARVEGRVVGPAGQPAAGIEVRLDAVREEGERPTLDAMGMPGPTSGTDISDGRGRFLIESVAPGRTYRALGRGERFVVSASEPFDVDAGGRTVNAPVLRLRRGTTAQVEVRGPSGDVVGGAAVVVRCEPEGGLHWDQASQWRPHAEVVTNASGVAAVEDLPDGKATLTASADGHAPSRASIDVAVATRANPSVVLRLRPAVTVGGTVLDQHGQPVVNGRLSLGSFDVPSMPGREPPGDDATWVPHQSARTDDSGRFAIEGVPADAKVRLSFHAEGYQRKTLPLEGRPDGLQLVVQKIDPEVQRRRQELQAEMMKLYTRLQSVEDDAVRDALIQRIQEVETEVQRLQGGGGAPVEVVAPPPSAPVEEDR